MFENVFLTRLGDISLHLHPFVSRDGSGGGGGRNPAAQSMVSPVRIPKMSVMMMVVRVELMGWMEMAQVV